jgi:hypothetical protein
MPLHDASQELFNVPDDYSKALKGASVSVVEYNKLSTGTKSRRTRMSISTPPTYDVRR